MAHIRFCRDDLNNIGRHFDLGGDKVSNPRAWKVKRAMTNHHYLVMNVDTKVWKVIPRDKMHNLY